jgi:peroxiredoxin
MTLKSGLRTALFLLVFLVRAALGQSPVEEPVELKEGRDAMAQKKYALAVEKLSKANKKMNKSCVECYARMSQVFISVGQYSDALKNADSMLVYSKTEKEKGFAHLLRGGALARLGQENKKKLPEAESAYRAALAIEPENAHVRFSLGVILLRQNKDEEGIKELQNCAPKLQGTREEKTALQMIANPDRARNSYAPPFSIQATDGQQYTLESLAGRVIVLDFWATWCPPCVASVPELKRLVAKMTGKDFVLISISSDNDKAKWSDFIDKKQMKWPQYLDSDEELRNAFDVHVYPTYFVIDRNGRAFRVTGEGSYEAYQLENAIKKALEGKPLPK